jgi:hypothetical protein
VCVCLCVCVFVCVRALVCARSYVHLKSSFIRFSVFWVVTQRMLVVEICAFLGHYAAYIGLLPDRLSGNDGKELPIYPAQYSRRVQISSTSRWKPKITYVGSC